MAGMEGCHFQRVKALIAADYPPCVDIIRWLLQQNAMRADYETSVPRTFVCDGAFNTHNEHVWVKVNLHTTYSHAHHCRFSFSVWIGIVGDNLIG